MSRKFIIGALFSLLPCCALAQGTDVLQSGTPTPGHVPVWVTNGVIGDGGPALSGKVKELGITNTGTPFCINDAPITGRYHQFCIGASAAGGGVISYNAYGGAPTQDLTLNVNGVNYPLPFAGIFPTAVIGNPDDWIERLVNATGSTATLRVEPPANSTTVIAVLGAARSSDSTLYQDQFGLMGFGINDRIGSVCPQGPCHVWGAYVEAQRLNGISTNQQAIGIESDTIEYNNQFNHSDPYIVFSPNLTAGVWVASGGGRGGTTYPSSVGVGIINNQSPWITGILISWNALANGPTGIPGGGPGEAISMGQFAQVSWYEPTTHHIGSFIRADKFTSTDVLSIQFDDPAGVLVDSAGPDGLSFFLNSSSVTPSTMFFMHNRVADYNIGDTAGAVFEMNDLTGGPPVPFLDVTSHRLSLGEAGSFVVLPHVTTGTPVASLCIDSSNVIIKKTTAGPCI